MSIKKNLKYLLLFLAFVPLFVFGCEKSEVKVNNISIELENQSQVVLLVDEFFDFDNKVSVSPNYATDKSFSVYSLDEDVVRVVGKQIKAIKEGETMVRVVSNSNQNVEDVVTVKVFNTQTQLETPTNLHYNEQTQSFSFNPVDYAYSYSININNREFNIGNATSFDLANYVGEKFNNVLSVKVRANAPTYTYAYSQSNYSEYIKIFQTSSVDDVNVKNGILSYSGGTDIVFDVYFNNSIYIENTTLNSFDLTNLDSSFAGTSINIYVVAKPSETISNLMGADVQSFSSHSNEIVVNVIDEPTISVCDSIISWEDVAFVDSYQVYINNRLEAVVNNNLFNLKELNYFNNINPQEILEVKVKSVFKNNGTNLAKTSKTSTALSLIRLATPQAKLEGNVLSWQAVENANIYAVEVLNGSTTVFSTNTNKTTFDMSSFNSGNYTVKISAVGSNTAVNYLTSKAETLNIVKDEEVTASVSNYVLTISAVENYNYAINFVIDSKNTYNQTILANTNKIEIDLSAYNFSAGNHTISITKLGNNAEHLDSVTKTIEFTQFEATNVNISSSIASITRSTINKNAEIYLEISGDSLSSPIKVKADNYTINTTDTTKTYLPAGDYSVVAYIEGNGSSTFSYGENKTAVACGKFDFKVLDVPSLKILNSAVAQFSVGQVKNATNYTILDGNNLILDSVNDSYSFSLTSGETKQFKVMANGNGRTILSSTSSNVITVSRLATPTMSFNAGDLSFDVSANNQTNKYEKVNFYFDDLLNETYSFGSEFENLEIGENKFKVNLKSKGNVDGVEYIDSLFDEIIVKKLSNTFTASIDSNNKLNISNSENAQLMLSFNFDTNEYLAENGSVAGLHYVENANKYIVTLLDNNFNAIKNEMANGFSVKVKYIKQTIENSAVKTYYTNSDWSEFVALKLNTLNSVSSIYSNTDNKLIVENPNGEKLFLDLTIQTSSGELVFADNGRNQLVNDGSSIKYSYSNNKYFIDLYNNSNIDISGITNGSNFVVKAKLKKTILGSSVDSELSSGVNVNYLKTVKFDRDDQTLYFTTINNDYGLDKYKLILNDKNTYSLNNFASLFTTSTDSGLTKYSVSILDLLNAINDTTSLVYTNINSLKLETLNTLTTAENVLLGSTGENIYLQQAQTFEVTSSKIDGKTVVNINRISTEYAKSYYVKVLEYTDYEDAQESISVVLDDLTFSGELSVFGFVKANSTYNSNGRTVNVFNSNQSNSLLFNRLEKPELTVFNNAISYTSVVGATEYEVFKKTSNSTFEKVDESILTRVGNSFMFNNLGETAEFTVAVKAVTSSTIVLNSNLSEDVTVVKLGKSSYTLENGNVKLSLPSGVSNLIKSEDVTADLVLGLGGRIYNCAIDSELNCSIGGINWIDSTDKLNIHSGLIFDYKDDYIIDKNISVMLQLNGKHNNKYYIYTDENVSQVKGLFAPTNVRVDKIDSNIEKLSYTNNEKNKLSADGELLGVEQYMFRFVHDGITYESADSKLKYYNGTNFVEYGIITSTNVAFPYGYDANDDGDFEDEDDVVFDYGEFIISVACYTSGYAVSPYSQECIFSILNQTEVEIQNGELNWTQVSGADKYILRIRESNTVVFEKEINDLSFDFEEFDNSGLFDVTIQAVTNNLDVLNGKETNPIKFYRLKTATEIKIDNGSLAVKASPFVKSIKVIYGTKTLICENKQQKENLKSITSLADFNNSRDMLYYIDITHSSLLVANLTEKIKIQLCGNTGVFDAPIVGEIGMINSQTIEDDKTSIVLGMNFNNVSKGVWTFSQHGNLGNDDKVKINYNFNGDSSMHEFWLDTIVYEISIISYRQEENKTNVIYAVDYNRFISAVESGVLTSSTSNTTYYELCDDLNLLYAKITCVTKNCNLYFNVYKNNTIDLQNYDYLYYYQVDFDYSHYTSVEDLQSIDLASGGTFAVQIRTVGGDELNEENVAYLTSTGCELKPFVRFGKAYLSTISGQLTFGSLKVEDQISPVYKLTVYEWNGSNSWFVYLYDDSECTETELRQYFNLDSSVIVEPINEFDSTVFYEMGKHFGGGIYKVDVRAMAGVGADDFLLNAKKPENKYVVKVFSSTTPTVKNGNITFDLAYVNIDGENKYSYDYEIAVEYNGTIYSERISSEDTDVVVNGTKLTYTFPDKIGELLVVSGNNYKLKVRALTEDAGFINAKFAVDGNGTDRYLSFTRSNRVSDVKIENGILKWYGGSSASSYIIKLMYYNAGCQNIIINSGYVKNGENYSYTFTDNEYSISGSTLKTYIIAGLPYTISVARVGDSVSVINSSYEELLNVFRLNGVNANEIQTEQGLLTWTNVASAVGYKVELIGSGSYNYSINSNTNSLDLTQVKADNGNILPVGNYTVKVTALGDDKINSVVTTSTKTISKLDVVKNIQILGDSITWDDVENANGYRVKFIYNNKETQLDVTSNSVKTPTDVVSKLKVEIMALAVDNTTLLNSNVVMVETSSDTPSAVTGLTYNNQLNRFEWKTQTDFLNTDKIRITYNFVEYTKDGELSSVAKEITITHEQAEYYDSGTYFYPITIMGKYNNFTIRVQRTNSVDSATVVLSKDLCLFSYGAGTSENPYVLNNLQSLINIKYYPNAVYKLICDIDITSKSNTYIIDTEFAGTILGENYAINLGEIELTNAIEFALFKGISGATIEKLSLQANITNSITKVEKEIKLSILAVTSKNANLQNVRINSSSISVVDDGDATVDLTDKLYIGGMFALDTGSTLNSCSVIFSLTSNIDSSSTTYIGGMVASGSQTTVENKSIAKLTIVSARNEIRYLGGVAGYYAGNETQTTGVTDSSVELNFENINILYAGGIFGYSRYAVANNNTITGNMKRENITGSIYVGGVAGTFVSGTASGNIVNATMTLSIQSLSGTQRLGLIIGSMEIYNGVSCELSGNYSSLSDKTDLKTNSTLTLGAYGYKAESVVYTKITD